MREIKFRAIHKLTKKKWTNEELVFHNGAWYEDWRAFEDGTPLNMSQCAVMQYTGLKDATGVEIYEHDIFRFGGRNYVIMYNLGSFGCFEDDKYFPLEEIFYRNGEVVGNIYENPDLLERD